jgi:hypothetical protein
VTSSGYQIEYILKVVNGVLCHFARWTRPIEEAFLVLTLAITYRLHSLLYGIINNKSDARMNFLVGISLSMYSISVAVFNRWRSHGSRRKDDALLQVESTTPLLRNSITARVNFADLGEDLHWVARSLPAVDPIRNI